MEPISTSIGAVVVVLFLYLGIREVIRDYKRSCAASLELEEARKRPPEKRILPVNHITDPRIQ